MKSLRRLNGGYTITEVMIVLAVSAAVFASAIAGFSQQNNRTQFSQAIRDLETKLQDLSNDVTTGYYPASDTLRCERQGPASSSYPFADNMGSGQGTNKDCIFIGRAFDLSQSGSTKNIYTIFGLTNKSNNLNELSTNVNEAANRAIIGIDGAVESFTLHGSIEITRVLEGDGSMDLPIRGMAIISGFGTDVGGNSATTSGVTVAKVRNGYNFTVPSLAVVSSSDLNKAITICISEAGGGRHATITVGDGSRTNIKTVVDVEDSFWNAGCGAGP